MVWQELVTLTQTLIWLLSSLATQTDRVNVYVHEDTVRGKFQF